MSPRDSFWFLAGVLVAVAIMVSVRAWLRERPAPGAAATQRAEGPTANGTAERPTGRRAERAAIPVFAVPVAAGLALVGVALGIYFLLESQDSIGAAHAASETPPPHDSRMSQQTSATAGSLDDVTNKLAARLATDGGSDNDWKLLAQSYEYMGRNAEAEAARAHIASAAPTADATGAQIADIADALDKPHAKGGSHVPGNARAN